MNYCPSRYVSIYQRRMPSVACIANGLLNAFRFDVTVWTGCSRRRRRALAAENPAVASNRSDIDSGCESRGYSRARLIQERAALDSIIAQQKGVLRDRLSRSSFFRRA